MSRQQIFSIFNGPKPLAVPDSNVPQNIYPATPRTAGGREKERLFYHPQSGEPRRKGLKNTEAATGGFCKKGVLKNFANFTEKHRVGVFLIKLQVFQFLQFSRQVFQKETATQVLSCEVSKTFKSVYFEEHLKTTASGGFP